MKRFDKTNDLVKSVIYSEKLIIYGNRYRSSYPNIDEVINNATDLFNKGQYKRSFDLLVNNLKELDDNLLERLGISL